MCRHGNRDIVLFNLDADSADRNVTKIKTWRDVPVQIIPAQELAEHPSRS